MVTTPGLPADPLSTDQLSSVRCYRAHDQCMTKRYHWKTIYQYKLLLISTKKGCQIFLKQLLFFVIDIWWWRLKNWSLIRNTCVEPRIFLPLNITIQWPRLNKTEKGRQGGPLDQNDGYKRYDTEHHMLQLCLVQICCPWLGHPSQHYKLKVNPSTSRSDYHMSSP